MQSRSFWLIPLFLLMSSPAWALINLGFASWELGPQVRVGALKGLNDRGSSGYGGGVGLPSLKPERSRSWGLGLSNHFHFSDWMLSADLLLTRKKLIYTAEDATTRSAYDQTFHEIELPILIWHNHDFELVDFRYGVGVSLLRGKGKVKTYAASSNKQSGILTSVSAEQKYSDARFKQNHYGLSAGLGLDVNLLLIKLATDLRYTYVPERDTNPSTKTAYHGVELGLGILF